MWTTLGESDIECLDTAIEKYGHMPFDELHKATQEDGNYQAVAKNRQIPLHIIVHSLPDGESIWDYMQSN